MSLRIDLDGFFIIFATPEYIRQIDAKIFQTHQQQRHGRGFIEIADQGQIVRDNFENSCSRVENIEQGDQADTEDQDFFHKGSPFIDVIGETAQGP